MKVLAVIVLLAASAWALASFVFGNPTYKYRYRLTLEIEADGKRHTGSSVVEVQSYLTPKWSLQPNSFRSSVTGEATVVDLGQGRLLVALLEGVAEEARWGGRKGRDWIGPTPDSVLPLLFGLPFRWKEGRNEGLEQLVRIRGAKDLRQNQLPTLVSFHDSNNPTSIFVVDPENLPRSFGPGVRLSRATIEITDAKITNEIEEKLPWLSKVKGLISGEATCKRSDYMRPELPFCPNKRQLTRSGK